MQNVEKVNKKACLISLGCKVNKYEIECMANILSKNGWQVSLKQEVADLYVVNTCAVTNEGEKKSRQYIAKLIKLNPTAKIVVCGCASQNNLEQFKILMAMDANYMPAEYDGDIFHYTSPTGFQSILFSDK